MEEQYDLNFKKVSLTPEFKDLEGQRRREDLERWEGQFFKIKPNQNCDDLAPETLSEDRDQNQAEHNMNNAWLEDLNKSERDQYLKMIEMERKNPLNQNKRADYFSLI